MPRRVIVVDTSILCCYLKVSGKDTAGSGKDSWNHERAARTIDAEVKKGSTLVLPVATLIESGNHIAQAPEERFECARRLATLIKYAGNAATPWAAFTEQAELWNAAGLIALSEKWPALAARKLSMGDATIQDVAAYYARIGWDVDILTSDAELKSYRPPTGLRAPRRRDAANSA